jgi:3-isopropylmalate/(R)-2-methylmalate dehydratase small subunit
MKISGKALCLGDNIDTDLMISGKYLTLHNPEELKAHCFESLGEGFTSKIHPGDILVAGKNFGCGSSREQAPVSIKATGISLVIAESIGSIFARNAINVDLPVVELGGSLTKIHEGDILEVDIIEGEVRNQTTRENYIIKPYPPVIQKILRAGGLMQMLAENISTQKEKDS